jgi:hypothetical protein
MTCYGLRTHYNMVIKMSPNWVSTPAGSTDCEKATNRTVADNVRPCTLRHLWKLNKVEHKTVLLKRNAGLSACNIFISKSGEGQQPDCKTGFQRVACPYNATQHVAALSNVNKQSTLGDHQTIFRAPQINLFPQQTTELLKNDLLFREDFEPRIFVILFK